MKQMKTGKYIHTYHIGIYLKNISLPIKMTTDVPIETFQTIINLKFKFKNLEF